MARKTDICKDEYDALRMMIDAGSKTTKELAFFLFPDKKLDSAIARVRACLNPEKDERFTFGQIVSAMKFCECYIPLYWACDETLHDHPERMVPKDEELKLMQTISNTTEVLQRAMAQLEQLKKVGI